MEIDKTNFTDKDGKLLLETPEQNDRALKVDQCDAALKQVRTACFGAIAVLENDGIYKVIEKDVKNSLDVTTVIGKIKTLLEYLDDH